jgi:hypothetical protein
MIGKYLISALFLCLNLTILRLQKKSQRLADSKEAFVCYFLSCCSQMVTRTMDASIFFR